MPFYYDLNTPVATNATSATETTHIWGKTIANQETVSIVGLYAASRFGTAGGGALRLKDNTGTSATSGTSQVLNPKNRRGNPAAQSVWSTTQSSVVIGAGGTLLVRLAVGFAQTGGMGGYVPIVPSAAIQMMPNATNPVDIEIVSVATSPSVTADITIEIAEGI